MEMIWMWGGVCLFDRGVWCILRCFGLGGCFGLASIGSCGGLRWVGVAVSIMIFAIITRMKRI